MDRIVIFLWNMGGPSGQVKFGSAYLSATPSTTQLIFMRTWKGTVSKRHDAHRNQMHASGASTRVPVCPEIESMGGGGARETWNASWGLLNGAEGPRTSARKGEDAARKETKGEKKKETRGQTSINVFDVPRSRRWVFSCPEGSRVVTQALRR